MNRTLGRTGLQVAPIAFGAFKIGRNEKTKYPQDYELPCEQEVAVLLNAVLDNGINLIDTAPAYGRSESLLGEHLESRRDEFVLCTKVGELFQDGRSQYRFDADAINTSLDNSIRRLRSSLIDVVHVHSDGNDQEIIRRSDALETLQARRERGDLRFIGFSGKTIDGQLEAIATGVVDVVMVEYNKLQTEQQPVIDAAHAAGVGVLVKKGLASGRIPAEEAIPFCLAHPAVASVVIGSLNPQHLEANLQLAMNTPD